MATDDNGLKQGMVPSSELQSVSKMNDTTLPKSEATVSGIGTELNSNTRNDYDKPYGGEHRPHYDSHYSDESDSSESPKSESFDQPQQWSMVSVSPRAGIGNFSSELYSPSAMKPPRSQTINRLPTGYDPNRIPSSVFAPDRTAPMDWSAASNDSLFSIHMGNNSFSRDHFNMQGDFKHDDWYCNTPLHTFNNKSDLSPLHTFNYSGEELSQQLPTMKTEAGENLQEFEKENLPAGGAHIAHLSVSLSNLSDDRRLSSAEDGRYSLSAKHRSRRSNESAQSSSSFAFPLLVGGTGGSFKVASPITKEEEALPQPQNQTEATTSDPASAPEQANSNWLSCILCRFRCCF